MRIVCGLPRQKKDGAARDGDRTRLTARRPAGETGDLTRQGRGGRRTAGHDGDRTRPAVAEDGWRATAGIVRGKLWRKIEPPAQDRRPAAEGTTLGWSRRVTAGYISVVSKSNQEVRGGEVSII